MASGNGSAVRNLVLLVYKQQGGEWWWNVLISHEGLDLNAMTESLCFGSTESQ